MATATSAGGGASAGVECGVDASKQKTYCNPGDRCLDAGRQRCKPSICVCPDGKVGDCR